LTSAATTSACPLCHRDDWQVALYTVWDYISDERFDIKKCRRCGLMVTDPIPGDEVIEKYYSTKYRGDRHAFTDRMRVALRARMLRRQFAAGFSGRLLDIGCGDGHFAMTMRDRGWKLSITEINQRTIADLRSAGMEALTPKAAIEQGFGHSFDAVTCWHVLEHVIDPEKLVRWVRTVLGEGGCFQVTVPNVSSWQARLAGRHWLHLDVPRHRYHFSSQTLERLLTDAGFEIIHRATFALEYDWFGAIQSALNALCTRPNVLFERMTSQTRQWPVSAGDRVLSCALGPPLAGLTLPACLLSWPFRRGATLTMTARVRRS
jgi:2-polyprenyl-3-methyl-5-hydroxy-6-metoxy-1,4-benzoquinol methylase